VPPLPPLFLLLREDELADDADRFGLVVLDEDD